MGELMEGDFPRYEPEHANTEAGALDQELLEDQKNLQQWLVFELAKTIHKIGSITKEGFNHDDIGTIKPLRIKEHALREGTTPEEQAWAETTAAHYSFDESDKLSED